MPPVTPSRILAMRGLVAGQLPVLVPELAVRDLFERDGEVVLRGRLDHRRRELVERPLAQVVVIGVDLARALGGDDHTGVVGVDLLHELVDARADHYWCRLARTIASSRPTASSRRSLTTTWANS